VDLARRLQLAPGTSIAVVGAPDGTALGTDLNRDRLASAVSERGARPVRQVAIDGTWSALRFRPTT